MNRNNIGWNIANMIDNAHLIAGTATGRGPSPKIWSNCPLLPILLDPTKGFAYFNDFFDLSTYATGTLHDGILLTQATGGTAANDPTVPGGILKVAAAGATADQGPTVSFPAVQCEPGSGTTIWMEWRMKLDVGGGQCFMGLADDSVTAVVTSSDAITANKDLAGFFRDSGTGDTDWSVGVCDGSSSEESDDQVSGASESAYEKFGLVFEGIGAVAGSRITFYHNGEPVHVISDSADLPLLLMCPTFQFHGDGTDTPAAYFDWLRVAVYNSNGGGRES